jgi:hypothetical protein
MILNKVEPLSAFFAERERLLRIYDYAERAPGNTRRRFRLSENEVRSVGRDSRSHNQQQQQRNNDAARRRGLRGFSNNDFFSDRLGKAARKGRRGSERQRGGECDFLQDNLRFKNAPHTLAAAGHSSPSCVSPICERSSPIVAARAGDQPCCGDVTIKKGDGSSPSPFQNRKPVRID